MVEFSFIALVLAFLQALTTGDWLPLLAFFGL